MKPAARRRGRGLPKATVCNSMMGQEVRGRVVKRQGGGGDDCQGLRWDIVSAASSSSHRASIYNRLCGRHTECVVVLQLRWFYADYRNSPGSFTVENQWKAMIHR